MVLWQAKGEGTMATFCALTLILVRSEALGTQFDSLMGVSLSSQGARVSQTMTGIDPEPNQDVAIYQGRRRRRSYRGEEEGEEEDAGGARHYQRTHRMSNFDNSRAIPSTPDFHWVKVGEKNAKPSMWPDWVLWTTMGICFLVMGILGVCLKDWASVAGRVDVDRGSMFMGSTAHEGATGDPEAVNNATEDGVVQKHMHHHRIPWQQYFALSFWYAMLLANACFTRLLCHKGIPHDCHRREDKLGELHSLQILLTMGFILAVLCAVIHKDRFGYLFNVTPNGHFRGLIFIVVFMGTSLVWGSLDLVPSLSTFSLTTSGEKSSLFTALLYVLTFGAVALIVFHGILAFKHNPLRGFLAYALSRLTIWAMYVLFFIESEKTAMVDFHLHHYMVGFLIAILAEFNHPISLLLLAIGSGIFVQGLAAYSADPLINRKE